MNKYFTLIFLFLSPMLWGNSPDTTATFEQWTKHTNLAIHSIQEEFADSRLNVLQEQQWVQQQLLWQNDIAAEELVHLLRRKIQIDQQLQTLENLEGIQLLKVRYRKGIDLIKLMYEKLLGLEHHFTGMQTFQNVMMLSNPNAYPEFQKAKDVLEKKVNKK